MRRRILPWIVLLFGLAATGVGTYLLHDYTAFKNDQRQIELVQQMDERLQTRMESYIGLLRGGSGLFAANQFVTPEQFRAFWQRLQLPRDYPGMQGYGFTGRFGPDRLEALKQSMLQRGYTNFQVWPPGPRSEYHAIIYLEPPDERNKLALGYDMATEPVRREAMDRARDTGEVAASGKVTLVQEKAGGPRQNGFLLYVPVYTGFPANVQQRRESLLGYVYSPFRAGDLLRGIFGTNVPTHVRLELFDGEERNPENFLAGLGLEPEEGGVEREGKMSIAGRRWTLIYRFDPQFNQDNQFLLGFSPVVGVLTSLLLFYLTRAEGVARLRAERAASQLQSQSDWLQVMLGSIGDGVVSTNERGQVEYMNPMAENLTGWRLDQARERPLSAVFDVINEETRQVVENPATVALRTHALVKLPHNSILIRKDGTELCIDDSAAPLRDRHGQQIGAILVFRDITDRRRAERRVNAQHAVTRILAEAATMESAAPPLLEAICSQLNFTWGVLWLVEPDGAHLKVQSLHHLPNLQAPEFEEKCKALLLPPGKGLPGIVWQQMEPVWLNDFKRDPRLPRVEIAQAAGIQTAFAFPILREKQVYGVLEFFSRELQRIDVDLLNVAKGLGGQIGQFIERTRAEQALQQSEALYRAISETAADGIITIDAQGRILAVNSALERIFAYERDELLGKNVSLLLPLRTRNSQIEGLHRFLSTGRTDIQWNAVEVSGLRKDGMEIPLEISFGTTTRDGRPIFVGMCRDVSKRREAEERLRQSEERFRLLVDEAEEYAIITTDAAGLISTWNSGAENIFGYSEPEISGEPLTLLFTDQDRERQAPEEEIQTAAHLGQYTFERWLQRKDGSHFWASGSLICLRNRDGSPRAYAKILRDITKRKEAEEAIRELNQELEERVQRRTAALQESKEQMEAFTYTVAHDLRAPLRAMQGFSQALLEDYAPDLDTVAQDFISRIMSSAQKMDALIQDLLAYSQLSRSDLSFEPVPVLQTIQEVLDLARHEIDRTRAHVTVQGENASVSAHQATFKHALANLIGNAIKFTEPGVSPKVVIRVVEREETVQVSVQDNGIGIAPEHHERIFRVFERLHGQEAYPGTGIGLAIVKKGVERMGGRVGLTSAPGEGSLFWIELPRAS